MPHVGRSPTPTLDDTDAVAAYDPVSKARVDRLGEIRGDRNAKLKKLDLEYQLADEGVHPDGSSKVQVAAKKAALRDLPPAAESHLAGLNDTDAIAAYDPVT